MPAVGRLVFRRMVAVAVVKAAAGQKYYLVPEASPRSGTGDECAR